MAWDYATLKDKLRPPRLVRRYLLVVSFLVISAVLILEVIGVLRDLLGKRQ